MAKKGTEQKLKVAKRTLHGRRPIKGLRREGLIPAVVYGRDMKPLSLTVNHRELTRVLHSKMGEHALVKLQLEGTASWEKPALVHEVQHDPVAGHIVHVDFHAIVLTEQLKVNVPVLLKGEAAGVKEDDGVMEQFLREVEVECLPTDIPEHIEFDVSALRIGDTVHVKQLTAPSNVTIIADPEGAIASIQAPRKEVEPVPEAAESAEPEVITEKKEEGEDGAAPEKKGEEPAKAGGDAKKDRKKEDKKEG